MAVPLEYRERERRCRCGMPRVGANILVLTLDIYWLFGINQAHKFKGGREV
jgi:hypothetical protein